MTAYIRFVLRFRWPLLVIMLAITIGSGVMISKGVIASSLARIVLGEHPGYQRYIDLSKTFLGGDVVGVMLRDDAPLSKESQRRMRKILRAVEKIPEIADSRSILDAQHLKVDGDTLEIQGWGREAQRADADTAASILEACRQDPYVKDLMLSRDGHYQAVAIDLVVDTDRDVERTLEMLDEIQAEFLAGGYTAEDIHIVGLASNVGSMIRETRKNILTLFPVVTILLLIIVRILFRRFWPAFIASGVALLGVSWTMGFSIIIDPQVNIMASLIPGVILIISYSDVVHLLSAYLLELGRGMEKTEAILAAGADVGRACVYTSLTTLAGFVSMSFVPTPMFRQFGLALGIGAAMSLWIAVTLVPILLSLFPAPEPWPERPNDRIRRILDKILDITRRIATERPRAVILVFTLATVVSFVGLSRLSIDIDFVRRMPADHKHRVDADLFRSQFAGATAFDLYLDSGEAGGALDAKLLARLKAWQETVEARPGVSRVVSIVDLIEQIHEGMTGDEQAGLPTDNAAIAQYLLLFESSGGEDLDRLIDFERRSIHAVAYLPTDGARAVWENGRDALALAQTAFVHGAPAAKAAPREDNDEREDDSTPGPVVAEVTGLSYLTGQWLDEMIAGQQKGLTFAFFAITIMMIIGMRSWRVGLLSMIPNSFPLLWLGGVLGLFYGQVDSDAMAVAMIAIGIGVDDTIHFLMRFRTEHDREHNNGAENIRASEASVDRVISRTFHYSGRGILITSIILVVGFSPFATADYRSVVLFGTLLPMTLVVALLADLLLVPALVKVGVLRF